MSVIQDAQTGDEIIVIQDFNVSPVGEGFSWKTSREFRVGERVRFVSFFQHEHCKDLPGLGWTLGMANVTPRLSLLMVPAGAR